MDYLIGKSGAQSSSAAYTSRKEAVSYLNNKEKYVQALEEKLRDLTVDMITVYSSKNQIDRIPEKFGSKEESKEYRVLRKQIEALKKDYDKFIKKYGKHCGDLPSEMPAELDVSTASNIMDMLKEKTPTIKTRDYLTLAKLKKRVNKLQGSVSRVANKMKTENLIIGEPELIQLQHDDIGLPSVNACVSKILRYLCEDENRSIGVVGSTGVGKTNVMKRLNNHLEGNMSLKLDVVIWIDYPEEHGTEEKIIEKMQDVIMERLKLKLEKANSIEQNAEIISMALSQKKYIVLIDQVSSTIDLHEVGILKDHKFGKVVVASSNNKVIEQMTDQQVQVRKLSEDVEELQDIFEVPKKRIQESLLLDTNPELVQVKHDDIDLPSKLKPVDFDRVPSSERLWVGETSLEKSKPAHTLDLQAEERYESEIREENPILDDRITKMSSDLGESMIITISMMGKISKFIETRLEIPSTSLQEISDSNSYFGLAPNKDDYQFSVMEKLELEPKSTSEYLAVTETPTAGEWSQAFVLNLAEKDNPLLPKTPHCPNLVLLFLQRNNQLTYIPPSFFRQMPNLCFLDLSHTKIKSLPSSLSVLTKLQVLLLSGCVCLDSLPTDIEKLVNMEVLDLLGAQIYDIPIQIGQLRKLRQLRVSFYGPDNESEYAHLPSDLVSNPNIIFQLKSLQALSIVVHPEDHRWKKIAGNMTKDVGKLEKLRYLQFYFPTIQVLEHFIGKSPSWEKERLRKFKFVVGDDVKRMVSRVPGEVESKYDQYDQCLRFVNGDEIPQVVTTVLTRTTAFNLDHHKKIQSLSEFGVFNFDELKFCLLRECPKIQFMIKGNERSETAAFFPNLEHLGFHYLWELEGICDHPLPSGSFKDLKYLMIHTCPKLEFIGSRSTLGWLSNLEEFLIEDCESVKAIFRENKKVTNDATLLPRLQKLVLSYLPQLVTLGTGLCLSKDKITIQCCPKLILEPQVEKSKKKKFLGFIG